MSHTFKAKGGTVFNFNSDLSGAAHVLLDESKAVDGCRVDGWIPASDLLEFVDYVRIQYLPLGRSDDRDQLAEELGHAGNLPGINPDLVERVVLALEEQVRHLKLAYERSEETRHERERELEEQALERKAHREDHSE